MDELRLKKGEAQEKFLKSLKSGPRTIDELVNTGIMPKRTLYDVRKKLLMKGKIKEIDGHNNNGVVKKLSLVAAEKLASDQELDFLLKLAESTNHEVRLESLQDLRMLSQEKGIPQEKVRHFLSSKIEDSSYEDGLKYLLETLFNIIGYAKKEGRYDILSEIKRHDKKFVSLVSDDSRDGIDRLLSMKILGELGDPLVLPPLIDIIEKDGEAQLIKSPKYFDKIDMAAVQQLMITTLAKISKEDKVLVWKHLYRLISKGDKRIAAKAKNILGCIRTVP